MFLPYFWLFFPFFYSLVLPINSKHLYMIYSREVLLYTFDVYFQSNRKVNIMDLRNTFWFLFCFVFYIPYNFKVLSIEVDAIYEPWVPNLIPVAKAYSIKNNNYFSMKLKFIIAAENFKNSIRSKISWNQFHKIFFWNIFHLPPPPKKKENIPKKYPQCSHSLLDNTPKVALSKREWHVV